MELTPLPVYRAPAYPERAALPSHPELLRTLPRRWRGRPAVLGALAGLLALSATANRLRADDQPALRVAPIFEHGEGKGAYGCMAVNPPAFLTEDEAREVIEKEARAAGLEFPEKNHEIVNADLPITDGCAFLAKLKPERKSPTGSRKGTLKLGGWRPKSGIGYKFVSFSDFVAWQDPNLAMSTAIEVDAQGAARRLAANLRKAPGPGVVAVFYEPLAKPAVLPKQPECQSTERDSRRPPLSDEEIKARAENNNRIMLAYRKQYETAYKAASAEQLRAQVRDFIAWLKAEGVI